MVDLTAGTGVVAGQYEIASKVSDDAITTVEDTNGDGGDISDDSIYGVINTGRVMMTAS